MNPKRGRCCEVEAQVGETELDCRFGNCLSVLIAAIRISCEAFTADTVLVALALSWAQQRRRSLLPFEKI